MAPELAGLGITAGDLMQVLDHGGSHRGLRSYGGVQTISSVNRSMRSFGETLSVLAQSDNDGGGSRGSGPSRRTSRSSWSSGGSSGGGRSGGGMGGGGGSGW